MHRARLFHSLVLLRSLVVLLCNAQTPVVVFSNVSSPRSNKQNLLAWGLVLLGHVRFSMLVRTLSDFSAMDGIVSSEREKREQD